MRGQLPIPLEARARYRLALRQSIGSAAISMGNRWSRGIRSNRTAARSHEAFPRREAIILFECLSENQSRILMPRGTKSRRTSRGRKRERKRGDGKGGTVEGGKKREETVAVWLLGLRGEAGKGVIRVKLGSPWFPWIPAGYLRRGSTRGRMNGRTDGRNERQPATARVSSDASPHLSVRI